MQNQIDDNCKDIRYLLGIIGPQRGRLLDHLGASRADRPSDKGRPDSAGPGEGERFTTVDPRALQPVNLAPRSELNLKGDAAKRVDSRPRLNRQDKSESREDAKAEDEGDQEARDRDLHG